MVASTQIPARKKRDFLDMADLAPLALAKLLDLAAQLRRGDAKHKDALAQKVLAMVFLDPSLRTRTSFEVAMFLHGGHGVVLEPGRTSWAWETRKGVVMDGTTVEHIAEAARVLGRYGDAVALRAFPRGGAWSEEREDRIIHDFAAYCEKPVINMESVRRHPCQGLADALTIRDRLPNPKGRRCVLMWAYHPKPLPTAVPASAAIAAASQGMALQIVHPPGYELDQDDMATIRSVASQNGGSVDVSHDLDGSLHDADVVYVKSWGAISHFGRPSEEAALRSPYRDWRMTKDRSEMLHPDGFVMHCLPVRRNIEIDDAVLDGPRSAVVDQAENRLHAQRALLIDLVSDLAL
ncbi:MAG TPA: N-acetylornithine carbamoyltransferase [Pseudomonadota bacterium]|nr:N-acetylornithine carbamoyltransferase [Pseudomonadota bacterium]HNN50625.1 N-acetylornithine carbamoyltransferase [Pseudomonadota bacterium]